MQIRKSFALAAATVVLVAACGNNAATTAPTTAPATAKPATAAPASAPAATATAPAATATLLPRVPRHRPPARRLRPRALRPRRLQPARPRARAAAGLDRRRRHRRRHARRQELQPVLVRGRGGRRAPPSAPPTRRRRPEADASDYATDIQGFVDQGYNIIVTVGFNLTTDTLKAAKANPNIWFIGVDQTPICVDDDRRPRPDLRLRGRRERPCCRTSSRIQYQEDQAGYLAGIVAAQHQPRPATSAPSAASTWCPPSCATSRAISSARSRSTRRSRSTPATCRPRTSRSRPSTTRPSGKTFADQFIASKPARRHLPGRWQDRQRHAPGGLQPRTSTASALTSTSTCRSARHRPDLRLHRDLRREAPFRLGLERRSRQIDLRHSGRRRVRHRCTSMPPTTASVSRRTTTARRLITADIQTKLDAATRGHEGRALRPARDNCGTASSARQPVATQAGRERARPARL